MFANICTHVCEGWFGPFFFFSVSAVTLARGLFSGLCVFEMSPPFAPQAKGGNRESHELCLKTNNPNSHTS